MNNLIIKEREFEEKLVELINGSGLPAIILKPVIKDIYEQLNVQEQIQYEQAIQEKQEAEEKEKKEAMKNEKDNIQKSTRRDNTNK